MMNPLWLQPLLSRAVMALLILAAQSLLPALAHAGPPDPSWIPGIYDDADRDDLVLLVSSGAGSVTPPASDSLPSSPPMVGRLGQAPDSVRQTLHAFVLRPRAPPAP